MPSTPSVDTLPESVVLETPDYYWEGPFTITRGSTEIDNFIIRTMIGFHGDMLEGSGTINVVDGDRAGAVSLTGARTGAGLTWFDDAEARSALECSAELSTDEQRMEGDWAYPCEDPENCQCGGGAGVFTLERVKA
jgi:hypothetical protein